MFPNDLTTVLDNYSVSNDYTITLKADGKPDYHWGTLIKRPNDIRMYARFDVPPEWTATDAPPQGYAVTRALLYVNHWITNDAGAGTGVAPSMTGGGGRPSQGQTPVALALRLFTRPGDDHVGIEVGR